MKQLTQKNWFSKKTFSILEDGVLVKTEDLKENLEYKIKFDELGFDTVQKRIKTANIPFFVFLAFDVLYVGLIISSIINHDDFNELLLWIFALMFFSVMTLLTFYNRNKNVTYLTGGQKSLELFSKKPDLHSVVSFIDTIHFEMRTYFKNKYLNFESDTPYEVKTFNINWLRNINAINIVEHSELIRQIQIGRIIGS